MTETCYDAKLWRLDTCNKQAKGEVKNLIFHILFPETLTIRVFGISN